MFAQILRNVVNLAMMDFPVEVVKTQLLRSIDRAPMEDMLKVKLAFKLEAFLVEHEVRLVPLYPHGRQATFLVSLYGCG